MMKLNMCILLCMSLPALQALEHIVYALDGSNHRVQNFHLTAETIEIGSGKWQLADVDSVHIAQQNINLYKDITTGVLLQDGSWLPAVDIKCSQEGDALHVQSPLGQFILPLEYIAAWGDIEKLPPAGDVDVLVLSNGNKPFGEIAGADADNILMQTDLVEEPLAVPISSIMAARLRSAPITTSGMYLELRTHQTFPPLRLWAGKQPRLAIAEYDDVQQFLLPDWSRCENLRVIGGNRHFLSDLRPSSVEEKGLFERVWNYSVNSNIDGSPLMLAGQRYDQALVLHSYSLLKWKIDKKYKRFNCIVAISDALGNEGNCIVRITVDGNIKWQDISLKGGKAPQLIDIDVQGANELSIEVDYGERYDIGDHCAIGAPYLIFADE
ncbi:MAG: NPCBM/NEW2 domain-containing protein [Planctomycetes bacterium]|nr:NPCBM/NEW2 domain-containing protein [Planctomycetota bacterium]